MLYGALIIIAGVLVIVFRRAILRVTGFAATTFYGRLGRRVARTQPVYMIIAGSLTVALGLVVVILGVLLPPYPG